MCNESNMTVNTNLEYDGGVEKSCLFNCEVDSDVTFVAGIDDDTWRIPGHRHVLTIKNQVFNAMLCGPLSNGESVIYINDVDKRAFEQLLRYLYEDKVSLQSVATARATLEAANKYLCPELVKECVKYLDLNLTPATVLYVFQNLRFFCSRIPPPSNTPTAPPLHEINNPPGFSPEESMIERCNYLLHNCLLFIDEHADDVLQQECIEELSYEDMKIIALRDSLNVTCEIELFRALNRWCRSECKRNKKELTPANRRQVLNELSYSVRYLLMTENEFIHGPQESEFLDLAECRLILARMKRDKNIKLSREQEEMLKKFATPRFYNVHVQPIHLSDRSEQKIIMLNNKANVKKVEANKKKKNKKNKSNKFMDDSDCDEKKNGCSCSCFGEGMLRAFVCIFD